MGELWRDLVEWLRRRPALWLPVLIADLLGYLINLGRTASLHALVMHETAQRSALGGVVVHTPLSGSALQSATVMALLFSWFTYFVRVLLYAGALVATAALVNRYLERGEKPELGLAAAFVRLRGGILELVLRCLAVYAIAALLFSWLSSTLVRHGHGALVRNGLFSYGLTLLVLLILSALLPPAALRVLAGRRPDAGQARLAQSLALILVIVASLLAAFVSTNSRQLAQVPVGARYPLEIVGSLVVALPYVLLFVGLSLLARRVATTGVSAQEG